MASKEFKQITGLGNDEAALTAGELMCALRQHISEFGTDTPIMVVVNKSRRKDWKDGTRIAPITHARSISFEREPSNNDAFMLTNFIID